MKSNTDRYGLTVTKSNGEKEFSVVSLPGMYPDDNCLSVFENGYIEFSDEEHQCNGWYDNIYLIKKDNNKIVMIDKEFKEISKEYDRIILNAGINGNSEYSSY